MLAQFDGSAHSRIGVGGAGAALFQVSYQGLELVDWCSYALPHCADNIEAYGALVALQLYQAWNAQDRLRGIAPYPLHALQGDIKPLLQHLQFTGRLRRSDLISTIDHFHQARSVIAPTCQLLYRPREANFIADFLAGQGSRFLLDLYSRGGEIPRQPFRIDVTPPIQLLLKQQVTLLGKHQAGKTVLCLLERVTCTAVELMNLTRHSDDHVSRAAGNLLTATKSCTDPLVVEYVASADDGVGRLYARQLSGQRIPRVLRLAVYGIGHQEIDMTGAHYEIVRRSLSGCTLPTISNLRNYLRKEWAHCIDPLCEEAVKKWPLYVINGGIQNAMSLLSTFRLSATPGLYSLALKSRQLGMPLLSLAYLSTVRGWRRHLPNGNSMPLNMWSAWVCKPSCCSCK